jgi:hypothetical protein
LQKQINTKLVRKLVRSIAKDSIYGTSYTDINVTNKNLRNVTFFIDYSKAEAIATELRTLLTLAGFSNKVKVTTSKENTFLRCGGNTYLRINKCVMG